MIELPPHQLPAHSRWFPAAAPGPAALAEHVLTAGTGRFWADRAVPGDENPRMTRGRIPSVRVVYGRHERSVRSPSTS